MLRCKNLAIQYGRLFFRGFPSRLMIAGWPLVIGLPSLQLFAQVAAQVQLAKEHPASSRNETAFEVASVRPNRSAMKPNSNVSLTSSDEFLPVGNYFTAVNINVISYIAFAYKLTNRQLQEVVTQVPWTANEAFDIQGRASKSSNKEEFRQMMITLLRDRFKFQAHFQTVEGPVYGLVFATPGSFGPNLRLHDVGDSTCTGSEPADKSIEATFPKLCDGISAMHPSEARSMKFGGRRVPLALFTGMMTGVGRLDRPLVNETGLTAPVDFALEWQNRPEQQGDDVPVQSGPTFQEALRQQLGLKLVAHKGPIQHFVVDHIERPDQN